MGLKNRNTSIKYIRLKEHSTDENTLQDDGKKRYGFFVGKDEQPYSELEGKITKLFYKDEEYEGNAIHKLAIVLQDNEGEIYQLALNVESTSYGDFVKYLASVKNPFAPISLLPKINVQNINGKEVVRRNLLISQNGEFAKAYFTKENPNGLPAWHSAKVGNKVVTDKSDYLDFLEKFVTDNFINKLPTETVIVDEPSNEDISGDMDDDLPF